MTEKNFEVEVAELKIQLAKASEELSTFKKSAAEQISQEIEALKTAKAELEKQVAELTNLAKSAKEEVDMEKEVCAEKEKMMKEECEAKVVEAEAKVTAMLAEKAVAERKATLATAGVAEDKIEEILKTWAAVSIEQFEEIAKLYASKKEVVEDTKIEKSTAGASFDIKAEGENINLNGASTEADETARQKALAEKLASKFTFKKKSNKKEDGE
jgi:hypothetical protein